MLYDCANAVRADTVHISTAFSYQNLSDEKQKNR